MIQYVPGMREMPANTWINEKTKLPELLCWALLDGKRCCILVRGHDNGVHENHQTNGRWEKRERWARSGPLLATTWLVMANPDGDDSRTVAECLLEADADLIIADHDAVTRYRGALESIAHPGHRNSATARSNDVATARDALTEEAT